MAIRKVSRTAKPNRCVSCKQGFHNNRWAALDLNERDIERYGRVLICEQCVHGCMTALRWTSKKQTDELKEANRQLAEEVAELREQVAQGPTLQLQVDVAQLTKPAVDALVKALGREA